MPAPRRRDGWTTLQACRNLGVDEALTGINLAPLVFRNIDKALGGRLRFLVSGGAALNPQIQRDFAASACPCSRAGA